MPELTQGLSMNFAQHAPLCQAVARSLGLSKRERQWPQLVARSYAASFCGCEALAEVLLTGGFVACPIVETLF